MTVMTDVQKRCLFCEKTGTVQRARDGHGSVFVNCLCSPGGQYELDDESFDTLIRWLPAQKREQFPLLSGYIREVTGQGEKLTLNLQGIDEALLSPLIPHSLDDKLKKLLLYLYRNASGPNAPIQLGDFRDHYNLTYSPNLQEFVYVIEELRQKGYLERRSFSVSLTPEGYGEAAALKERENELKMCYISLTDNPELIAAYKAAVAPKLRSYGYEPVIEDDLATKDQDNEAILRGIRNSRLVIADLTGQNHHVYYEAGYARGLGLEVIWTVRRDDANNCRIDAGSRPIIWDTPEQLAEELCERVGS